MFGPALPAIGRIALVTGLIWCVAPRVAEASFISSNPSWLGPDRGLSQIGNIPTLQVPASPGSAGGQVTLTNFNLNIINSSYVTMPALGQPPVGADLQFTSDVLLTINRNGVAEHWGIDGQRVIATLNFIDDWQGDGAYRRIKAEMYCEDIRFRRYDQDWVFSTILTSAARISPTRQSEGYITSELLADGQHRISGTFSVFLDVSLDDGVSWHEVSTPLIWQVVPGPASAAVLGLAGLCAVRRRR